MVLSLVGIVSSLFVFVLIVLFIILFIIIYFYFVSPVSQGGMLYFLVYILFVCSMFSAFSVSLSIINLAVELGNLAVSNRPS